MIRPPGTSIPMVSITVARLRQAGIGEARRNVCSVWAVPLRDLPPALVALGHSGLAASAPLTTQALLDAPYRLTHLTATAIAHDATRATSATELLPSAAAPRIGTP